MQIGYARVSTTEQKLDLQIDAIENAGCTKVFSDKASGVKSERKGLQEAFEFLREGDCLVVYKLDRLARSLRDLIEIVGALDERGIGFRSLQENIDTTTPGGKLVFHIFGSLAEFERELIRERTNAGLAAARARGKFGGRPAKLTDKQIELAKTLYADPTHGVRDICQTLGISRTTLYRCVKP